MTIGQSADKSYAYLMGVYLGDGCVTLNSSGNKVFRLNTIDADFAASVKCAINSLTDTNVSISTHGVKKSTKPNHSLQCVDNILCSRLVSDSNNKQKIPFFIDKSLRKAMIVGLMDSEGFVAEKTEHKTGRAYYMGFKSCDVWVPTFIRIVQSVGLKIGKVQTEKPYKEGYKTPTRFGIKMQSWVDSGMRFNIARKQNRVDRWASTVPYSERKLYPRKLISETARQATLCG